MTDTPAVRYFKAGWHPIELPPGLKDPPPKDRTGADGIDMTAEEVEAAAWAGNIALRMPYDVIGLDVDVYHGGDATLRRLLTDYGSLPNTWISHSGRNDGSGIRFYRVPPKMAWVSGLPGIETIRRDHRYAVVWPSLHPDGRQYGWYDQAEGGPTPDIPRVEDLPELPWPWIAGLSRADATSTTSRAVGLAELEAFVDGHDDQEAPGYIATIVLHFTERWVAGYSRHDTMQHCLIWAMESVRAHIAAARPTIQQLADVWVQAVHPDARRAELWSDVRTTEFEAMLRHAIGRAEAHPQSDIDKLHDDVAGIPMNPPVNPEEDSHAQADRRLSTATSSGTTSLFLDWSTFAVREVADDRRWLIEHFWPWGRSMALWAGAKTGKSELALWCAANLALGRHPWTGVTIDPIDVAYFDYEMTEDDLEQRLDDFNIDPRQLGRLHYALLPPLHALDNEQGGSEVTELVSDVKAQAAIFDTFGRAVTGDENEADTVRAFYRHTGIRLKALGVGYLRTDHAGKDKSKGQRGSSAKRDDVDVVWGMTRIDKGVLLDCTGSSRLSWVPQNLVVERHSTSAGVAYSAIVQLFTPAGTNDLVAELDRLGIPDDAGRPTVRAAMAANKLVGSNDLVRAAIRKRRERGQSGGQSR